VTEPEHAAAGRRPLLEVCVESVADVLLAEQGGADRVELCADLVEGGITPSLGSIRLAVERAAIPVMVMVRPRGGDFIYDDVELEVMLRDVAAIKEVRAGGVVFGCLTPDGEVDRERTARLAAAARPLGVTFHRAFDMTRDPRQSLETLIELGVDRVLSSGQEPSVPQGLDLLRELVAQAGQRLVVMPGAGLLPDNVRCVADLTRARELHFAALRPIDSRMRFRNRRPRMSAGLAPGEFERSATDPQVVRQMVEALEGRR
jgi:copper homeostasis protein